MHAPSDNTYQTSGSTSTPDPAPRQPGCRMDSAALQPVRDPLAALEAARRFAYDEEMAERWDGLS